MDKQRPERDADQGRHCLITSEPVVGTLILKVPEANTVVGTLGTYDALTQKWTMPAGDYYIVCSIHFNHSQYPAQLNESVTFVFNIGGNSETVTKELIPTFPGRTSTTVTRLLSMPVESELWATASTTVDNRVSIHPESFIYLARMGDPGVYGQLRI